MIRALLQLLGPGGVTVVVIALAGSLWGYGALKYSAGYSDGENAVWEEVREVERQKQLDVFELAEKLSRRTAELKAEREKRVARIERLENEAQADNPSSRKPSDSSLQRLEARWD